MRGILLSFQVQTDKLSKGDLVKIKDDGHDDTYYVIEAVDRRYNMRADAADNPYCYFIKSKQNGELMNFALDELSKFNVAFFNYDRYDRHRDKILLGALSVQDLTYMKSKRAYELDLGYSDLSSINNSDLLQDKKTTIDGIEHRQYRTV
jgi:hypothetical protein